VFKTNATVLDELSANRKKSRSGHAIGNEKS